MSLPPFATLVLATIRRKQMFAAIESGCSIPHERFLEVLAAEDAARENCNG